MKGVAWTGLSRHIRRLVLLAMLAALCYSLLRALGFYNFMARENEGLNTLILLVGSIYAVMLAFTIFVIWTQFNDVENCVMREATALDGLLRFSEYLGPDASHAVRRAMGAYLTQVLKYEWPALGDARRDKHAGDMFGDVVNAVVSAAPAGAPEGTLYPQLLDMARKAAEFREERVSKSLTRIPPTLGWLVNTMAAVLLLLVFAYPFHHWLTGLACFLLVGLILFLANSVMTDMDNPLQGVWNISPKPFSDLRL